MVGSLVSPHVSQAVFHALGTPEEVEHSQIFQHRLCSEHLRDERVERWRGGEVEGIEGGKERGKGEGGRERE